MYNGKKINNTALQAKAKEFSVNKIPIIVIKVKQDGDFKIFLMLNGCNNVLIYAYNNGIPYCAEKSKICE